MNVKMIKIVVLNLLLWFSVNALAQQVKGYELDEITVKLGDFDFNTRVEDTPGDIENFVKKTGLDKLPDLEKYKSDQESYEEFGYYIYSFIFDKSSFIQVRDHYISDFKIANNPLLSINSIHIGDSIEKVKKVFPKYNYGKGSIDIYYGPYTLGFQYDKKGLINKIINYLPL